MLLTNKAIVSNKVIYMPSIKTTSFFARDRKTNQAILKFKSKVLKQSNPTN